MKRSEIEARIATLQAMLAKERDCSTLATINRCLERLIMMDADDDHEAKPVQGPRI